MKEFLKKLPGIRSWYRRLDNAHDRRDWVKLQLAKIPDGGFILDAGCGSQQYRPYCKHLNYRGQDFGQFTADEKRMIGDYESSGLDSTYKYGPLDYTGDIWSISEDDNFFDAILCTEVFEHIPYPIDTLREFARLLKPGGILILTAPSSCLRHMDPYFFYSGFSDRWFEKFLSEAGFNLQVLQPVGDYYSWLGVEMARTGLTHGLLAKIAVLPAFVYFFSKKKTEESVNTLCMGYHIVATKL